MRWRCLFAMLALLASAAPALAETPSGTFRVFLSSANPTADWSGSIDVGFGVVDATAEADTAVGFGMLYEVRLNDRLGLESGIYFADFDFELSFSGMTAEFGSALAIPVTFGADFHLFPDARVDFYVGPLVSYTFWGNLDTPVGEAEIDGDFGFGGVVGLDVPLGRSGWIFNAAARYISTSAGDASVDIGVDPLFTEVGFGYRF